MSENNANPASGRQAAFKGVTRKVLERVPLPGDARELAVLTSGTS